EQTVAIVRADGMAISEPRDPGVAGCGMELREGGALRESPRERVLARARTDEEHPHGASLLPGFALPLHGARPSRAGTRSRQARVGERVERSRRAPPRRSRQ